MQLTSKRKGKEWYALPFLFLRVSYCRKIVIYKYNMVYNTIVRIFFLLELYYYFPATQPLSTGSITPFINDEVSSHKNSAALAISSGFPK